MGVTLWILDAQMRVRMAVTDGIEELIHDEADMEVRATIARSARAVPGEYLGLACVDGRFRLFAIEEANDDDARGATEIVALDAARAELETTVCAGFKLEGATGYAAAQAVLSGTGWTLGAGSYMGGETSDFEIYYKTAWAALTEVSQACGVRVIPRYIIDGGQVTGRVVDIEMRQAVFRGRIFLARLDATQIYITRTGRPIVRAYGLGKATGTTDPPERVTIADAAWSTANGDPVDKPAGQAYVEVPGASALPGGGAAHAMIYTDENQTDAAALLAKTWTELQKRASPEVSGEATVQDVEMQPGMGYKAVRLYDQIAIVPQTGAPVTAQVIGIERDYVYPTRTKIELGDEDGTARRRTLSSTVSALVESDVRSRGSGAAASNRIIQNEALIQLNAEAIQMNAKEILAQAEVIALKADYVDVQDFKEETETRFNSVSITLDAHKAEIELKAAQTTVDSLGERVSDAESTLTIQAGQIESKVSKDGVISSINQTPESVTISASRINLSGYVTASQLSAEMADLENAISDTLYVRALSASGFSCSSFDINGYGISMKSQKVVTGVGRTRRYALAPSGSTTIEFYECSSVSSDTIYYLSWE